MTLDVTLVIHPYTARKDLGAGHDRYAYELIQNLPNSDVRVSRFESGQQRSVVGAALAEVRAVTRLAWPQRGRTIYHATATMNAMAPITARKHPLVTTIHDVLWFFVRDRYDSKIKYLMKTAGIRRAAHGSDKVIVPFASTRDFLVDELGVGADRVHIVPYGLDHAQFYPPAADEEVPRPSMFPQANKIVLFIGATNLGKGIDTLLRCFPDVVREVPEAHLVVGSNGWDTPLLLELWENSPVKPQIHFIGFIPEDQLRAAYVHADVTAFPSRYGFGLATLESMACGTPTVSGRTLDAPEFIGNAGLMASPEDPDELAAQIVRLLRDRALYEDIAQKGLARSAAYRWDLTAAKTADVYRLLT